MDLQRLLQHGFHVTRAALIMPWVGFALIIPLIVPVLMLFAAPLRTIAILYAYGFVPSFAAACVHRAGQGRLRPILLIGLAALSGGVFCIGWQMALGVPVRLGREPEIITIIAVVATAIYFTLATLLARLLRPRSAY